MSLEKLERYFRITSEENKRLLEEGKEASSREDYNSLRECCDKGNLLFFRQLLKIGDCISELEDSLIQTKERWYIFQGKKNLRKGRIEKEIDSARLLYANFSEKLKNFQRMIQECGLTNAPEE